MLFFGRMKRFFRERARNIFSYFDGEKWCRADPLMIGIKLEEVCPDLQDKLDLIAKDANEAPVGPVRSDLKMRQYTALFELEKISRTVFGLKPRPDDLSVKLPDGVLSVAEAVGVLGKFWSFMHQLAEDAEVFRASLATA